MFYIIYHIHLISYTLYIISPGLNQINLIMYTTKFETFLLEPIFQK